MASPYLDTLKFNKVKAFLGLLNYLHFNLSKVPDKFTAGGMSLKKDECLGLLREFPELKDFKNDSDLVKFLSIPSNRDIVLREKLTKEQQIELEKTLLGEEAGATEEISGPAAPAGQGLPPAGSTTGGSLLGGMSLPAAPSISTPRIRFKQQTPPPGGMEGGTGQGTAATHKIDQLEAENVGAVTAKSDQLNAQTTTFQTEAQSAPLNKPNSAEVSNLRSTVPQRFNFSAFRSSAGSSFKKFQNFASPAGRFFQNTIGKHLTGTNAMNLLGKAGRTGINALSGINNFGSGGVSGFSPLGRFGRNGNGRGFLGRFSRGGGRSSSLLNKAKGRGGLVFAGGIIGFMLLVGGIAMTAPSPTPGQAAPLLPGTSSDLDKKYDFTVFNIFKSDAVDDDLLQKYIDRAFASGRIKSDEQKNLLPSRAKFIRDQAQLAGLNPAIFLGYWESETGFSDYTNPGVRPGSDLGCDPLNPALKTFEDSVLCAVGKSQITNSRTSQCAVSKDIHSTPCQTISFQQKEGVKLPISTLTDFLNSYGSKVADPNNARSDNIVKQTIVDLGLVPAIAATEPQQIAVTSCPIFGGKITCGSSKGAPGIAACHCTPSYSPWCLATSRRGKAVDITGPNGSKDNDPIYMPLINNRVLKWYFRGDYDDDYGATLRVFQSEPTPDGVWTIHFVHSKRRTNLLKTKGDFTAIPVFSKDQEITDLTQPVAYTDQKSSSDGVGVHTHVSIGLIGDNWYDGNLQYTNTGWKYADAEMGICQ